MHRIKANALRHIHQVWCAFMYVLLCHVWCAEEDIWCTSYHVQYVRAMYVWCAELHSIHYVHHLYVHHIHLLYVHHMLYVHHIYTVIYGRTCSAMYGVQNCTAYMAQQHIHKGTSYMAQQHIHKGTVCLFCTYDVHHVWRAPCVCMCPVLPCMTCTIIHGAPVYMCTICAPYVYFIYIWLYMAEHVLPCMTCTIYGRTCSAMYDVHHHTWYVIHGRAGHIHQVWCAFMYVLLCHTSGMMCLYVCASVPCRMCRRGTHTLYVIHGRAGTHDVWCAFMYVIPDTCHVLMCLYVCHTRHMSCTAEEAHMMCTTGILTMCVHTWCAGIMCHVCGLFLQKSHQS